MSKDLRDEDYLEPILEAISRINRYVADGGKHAFLQDEKTQDAVIRNLEIIGEAATKLSPELKTKHDEIPWGDIAGMRNRLIHGYFAVSPVPYEKHCQVGKYRGLLAPLVSSNDLKIVSNARRKVPLVSSLSGTRLNS